MARKKAVVLTEVGQKEVTLPAGRERSDCDEDIMGQNLRSMTALLSVMSQLAPNASLDAKHVAHVFDTLSWWSRETLEAFERSYS